jgi:hypothetical protein
MDCKTLNTYIGKEGRLNLDGFIVNITIKDARSNYGRTEVLVSPLAGSGERWVYLAKITLDK